MNHELKRVPSKARDLRFYLDRIVELGRKTERIEIYSTAGDILPPYPYQYRAVTNVIPGDDDPFEGVGGTPLEAVRELHKSVKAAAHADPEDDEE